LAMPASRQPGCGTATFVRSRSRGSASCAIRSRTKKRDWSVTVRTNWRIILEAIRSRAEGISSMKRGLFRLWVVLSVCWVGGITAVGVPMAIQQVKTGTYKLSKDSTAKSPIFEHANPFDKYDGGWIEVQIPDGSELYLYQPPALDHSVELHLENEQQSLVDEFRRQRWWRYWGFAWPWLTATFLPVISLLVLGRALLWVADGFSNPA